MAVTEWLSDWKTLFPKAIDITIGFIVSNSCKILFKITYIFFRSNHRTKYWRQCYQNTSKHVMSVCSVVAIFFCDNTKKMRKLFVRGVFIRIQKSIHSVAISAVILYITIVIEKLASKSSFVRCKEILVVTRQYSPLQNRFETLLKQ